MSLQWTIDPEERLVTAVADGDVTRRDVEKLLDEVEAAGATTYRRLFDGSRGDTSISLDDLMALGVRFRAIHAQGPMGPLAIVVSPDKVPLIEPVLGMLAIADRPMRLFHELKPARRWISKQVD
jgi:hypothetical protein